MVPVVAHVKKTTIINLNGVRDIKTGGVAVAIHPPLPLAYVVSTGASPNGPFRFNVNSQGLVSVLDTDTGREVTSAQVGADVYDVRDQKQSDDPIENRDR